MFWSIILFASPIILLLFINIFNCLILNRIFDVEYNQPKLGRFLLWVFLYVLFVVNALFLPPLYVLALEKKWKQENETGTKILQSSPEK
jgi:hypothetical protein